LFLLSISLLAALLGTGADELEEGPSTTGAGVDLADADLADADTLEEESSTTGAGVGLADAGLTDIDTLEEEPSTTGAARFISIVFNALTFLEADLTGTGAGAGADADELEEEPSTTGCSNIEG